MFSKNKIIAILLFSSITTSNSYSQFQVGTEMGYGGWHWDKILKQNRLNLAYSLYLKWNLNALFSPKLGIFHTIIPSNTSSPLLFYPGHLNMKNYTNNVIFSLDCNFHKKHNYSLSAEYGIGISYIRTQPFVNNNFELDFWQINTKKGHQTEVLPLICLGINYEQKSK